MQNNLWYAIQENGRFHYVSGRAATIQQVSKASFAAETLEELYRLVEIYYQDQEMISKKGKENGQFNR